MHFRSARRDGFQTIGGGTDSYSEHASRARDKFAPRPHRYSGAFLAGAADIAIAPPRGWLATTATSKRHCAFQSDIYC